MLIDGSGRFENGHCYDQYGRKHESLNERIRGSLFRPIPKFWSQTQLQDQPENEKPIKEVGQIGQKMNPAKGSRFLILIRRKRVCGYPVLLFNRADTVWRRNALRRLTLRGQ